MTRYHAHPIADDRRRANRALVRDTACLLFLLFLIVFAFPLVATPRPAAADFAGLGGLTSEDEPAAARGADGP